MKNAMIIALLSLTAVSASAFRGAGADREYSVFSCTQTPAIPDNTISLEVINGGITGMTRIQLSTSTFAGPRTENYFVRQQPQKQQGLVEYAGDKIALAISSQTDSEGYRVATLKLKKATEVIVRMHCQQHMRRL